MSNQGDQKIKTAAGKVPLQLIPLHTLKGAARVYGYGAKKYAKGNWYKASDEEITERYTGAILRHLADCQLPDGTWDFAKLMELDDESGLPNLDHAICSILMLRGLAIKHGAPADPGPGEEPPTPGPTPRRTPHIQLELPLSAEDRGDCGCEVCR